MFIKLRYPRTTIPVFFFQHNKKLPAPTPRVFEYVYILLITLGIDFEKFDLCPF